MRFMTMIKAAENAPPPPMELMAAIGNLAEEAARAGVRVEMGGLVPSAAGARIRIARGKLTVTDGPFAEGKEVVGGYAFLDVKSRKEAIEWSKRFMSVHLEHWKGFEGECEIRQVMEAPPGGAR